MNTEAEAILRVDLRALGEPESSIDYRISQMRITKPLPPNSDDELDADAPALTPNPSTGD